MTFLNHCFFSLFILLENPRNNVKMADLTNEGYSLVYDYPYSHATTRAEILNIRSQCTLSSLICVGGNRINEDLLLLVACANCLSVTSETTINQPQNYSGVYWYFTDGQSFGFAPNSNINQVSADAYDLGSNLRLSWQLQGGGGYRLGSIIDLGSATDYSKKIYITNPTEPGKLLLIFFYILDSNC